MYFISSVEDLQDLNPFIVIGCGGGGEKFANFEGVKAIGFIDDDITKHGLNSLIKQYSQILINLSKKQMLEV